MFFADTWGKGLAIAVVILCSAAACIGCGGGGGSSASDRPLTKAEFIRAADAICSKGVAKKEARFAAGLKSGKDMKYASQAEVKGFVEDVTIGPYSEVVAGLSELHPKLGDKAALAVVRGYEKALEELKADPMGATEQNPFIPVNEAAAAYGIDSCEL